MTGFQHFGTSESLNISMAIVTIVDTLMRDEDYAHKWHVSVYANGREEGLCLWSLNGRIIPTVFRNTDMLTVYDGPSHKFDNNNMYDEEVYQNSKGFEYDDFVGTARYIIKLIRFYEGLDPVHPQKVEIREVSEA